MKKLLLLPLLLLGCTKKNDSRFDIEKAVGLDVRSAQEVQQNPALGEIVHLPMGELAAKVESRIQDKNTPVAIFCESGGRASVAKVLLLSKGYKNIKNIGSWRDWNKLKTQ